MEEMNKYWCKEDEMKCMLCERGRAMLEHWLVECERIGKGSMTMGKILHEKGVAEESEWLRDLETKKRENEEDKEV